MRKSFDAEGVQFAWDSTSLTVASECLRKYYYSIQRSVVPQQQSVHLIFGGLFAKALETFYAKLADGCSRDEALHIVIRDALILSWKHDLDPMGNRLPGGEPIVFNSAEKTRYSLLRSIVWYVDHYAEADAGDIRTATLQNGKAAVELSFTLEFSDDILYCGHLDRVVEANGHLFWMDQKTTGKPPTSMFWNGFQTSNQFLGYTWAGQTLLRSPVRGGIVDAVAVQVGGTIFERQPITFNHDVLEEWRIGALYHIEQAREATLRNEFPMNLTACGNYGGCPYRVLCTRAPSVRDRFIGGDFVERENPWDPLVPR
jgi:hypothetical protein